MIVRRKSKKAQGLLGQIYTKRSGDEASRE